LDTFITLPRMLLKNSIKLLRIPFSFFLMPVFLFALSQAQAVNWGNAALVFVVLHLFIYPASNAYNSYMDQDEGPIGGLRNPPKATREVFYAALIFDITGLLISLFVSLPFTGCVLLYILASRAYSYKGIRLKKYPLAGYFTVVFFQGAFTYYMCYEAISSTSTDWTNALISSLLIGGVYPLTQVYQHEEDARNGDQSISLLLGYRGTFILTAVMFGIASGLFFMQLPLRSFLLLDLFLLPVIVYFLYWAMKVWKDTSAANFDHTMRMNLLASACMNTCFTVLTILSQVS
jgi:1,4-dihydroxy-2-naphthoate octaprenyltransferase